MPEKSPEIVKKCFRSNDIADWDEWKGDVPFWQHIVAGSIAGLSEHSLIFPVDTIKTHVQASRFVFSRNISYSLREICQTIYTRAGYMSFFRGLGATCVGSVPAHACLFSVYEATKKYIGTDDSFSSAVCGGAATMSHDIVLTPIDVVKQRLQLGRHKNAIDCVKSVYVREGITAFFRSLPTTMCMNVPYGAIFLVTYELLKEKFCTDQASLPHYFFSAGIAGGVAGVFTTPLDVLKTRLQTESLHVGSLM